MRIFRGEIAAATVRKFFEDDSGFDCRESNVDNAVLSSMKRTEVAPEP
jgi:hypothetical protein